MKKTAVLLITHGSKEERTMEEVGRLEAAIRKRIDVPIIVSAFLEINEPDITEGIERCVRQGAEEIIITLNFLNSGNHVLNDIPAIVERSRHRHPRIEFIFTRPVGQHPRIVDLFVDMITQAK